MKTNYYLLIIFLFLSVTSNSQTITAISPATGAAGTTVTAILTGQNTFFQSGSPQGIQNFYLKYNSCRTIVGTNFVVLNDDSIQVDIPIPAGYINGVYDVSARKSTFQTMTLPASFTITGGIDQGIQGFSPSTATEGSTISAQITGQDLQTIASMQGFTLRLFNGSTLLVPTNLTVISPGQINADFFIPPFADTGYYNCNISVVGNCYSMQNALHVGGLYPKQLLSMNPASGNANLTITTLVTGQNTFFMSSSPQGIQSIKLSNANCNVINGSNINMIDDENLDVDFTIPANASNGQYELSVKLNSGQTFILLSAFTINNGIDRSVNVFSPNTATAGTTLNATIDGAGLADIISQAPVTIKLRSTAGFIITPASYSMSGLQLLADFNIPPFADNGFYKLEITSGAGCYSLNNAVQVSGGSPPAIVSITPNQGLRGQTLTALMTGSYTYFMPGTQSGGISNVLFTHTTSGSFFNVQSQNITFIDSEHVNLNFTIPPSAHAGFYNVAVHRVNNNTLYLNPGFEVRGTVVSGYVFLDVDSNGIFNTGDYKLPNQRVNAYPDNVTTFTNQSGDYSVGVEPGIDTISVTPDTGWVHTSPSSFILSVGANDTSGFNFGVRPLVDEFEVLLEQTSGFPRCNQNVYYNTTFKNISTNVVDATIWWLPDSNLNVVSNNPPPTFVNGDTLFWTVTNLLVQTTFTINSVVHMPGPGGPPLRSYSCAEATYNGNIVATSCDSVISIVSCSFDPNDKAVEPEGIFAQHYVLGSDYLTYQIRFQNTGNDTAFAVSIFDTLNPSLDLSTFELISNSHPVTIYLTGNVVEFRFVNILLPDSIVDEPGSHGFVKFRIKPVAGYVDGTAIENTASIHFDLNAPVITNTTMSTIVSQLPLGVRELSSGERLLILYPNPTSGPLFIELPARKYINGTVLVVDQTGRVLRRLEINSERGEINLGAYLPGIYTVVLMDNDGIFRGKVIIQ